jgi:hypothetical protein
VHYRIPVTSETTPATFGKQQEENISQLMSTVDKPSSEDKED